MKNKTQPFGLFERMLAGRYLRAKRQHGGVALISVISVTAIALAVFALITTMSVMNGFRETLLSRILGVDGHVFVSTANIPDFVIDQIEAQARQVPGVISVAPTITDQALVTVDGHAAGVQVRGMRREDLERLTIVSDTIGASGSLEGFEGVDAPTIIIGDRLAAGLGLAPGMELTVIAAESTSTIMGSAPRRKAFRIGGIFSVGMSQYDSAVIYMPLEQARILFNRNNSADELEIRVADPDRSMGTMIGLRDRLGPELTIMDWRARSQGLADALVVERNVMRLILMVLVAIAALNIITGLIMLVKNKSRDIAILRTMGATRGSIQRVFFMASATLGISGLAIGLLLGLGFCLNIKAIQDAISFIVGFDVFPGSVYSLETLPAKVEWSEVVIISVFTVLVTFISTWVTAWWASRFDPVESLRYE